MLHQILTGLRHRVTSKRNVVLALFSVAASQAWSASFVPLGFLPNGFAQSEASGVSADGAVVVGSALNAAGATEPYRWTQGSGMVGLGFLPGGHPFPSGGATAVSADGLVVVGSGSSFPNGQFATEGFRWTQDDGMIGIGDLPNGQFFSNSNAISGDGSIVVGASVGSFGATPVRWTASDGIRQLDPSTMPSGNAAGISGDGTVVVGTRDVNFAPLQGTPYRWTQGTGYVALADLPSGPSYGRVDGVSDDGRVAVGFGTTSFRSEAVRWINETGPFSLGDLPGGSPANVTSSEALAASADGSIIVGTSALPGSTGSAAFIWDEVNGMRKVADVLTSLDVDLMGWQLYRATGISNDGTVIVGAGFNPLGQSESWRATLATVPEPEAFVMVCMAAAFLSLLHIRPTRTAA